MPVVVGVFSKAEGPVINSTIFYTMLISVGVTVIYRMTDYAEDFDPAVFGVAVSVVTYFVLRAIFTVRFRQTES